MKILALISAPTLTGTAAFVSILAKELSSIGHDVLVATDTKREGNLQSWLDKNRIHSTRFFTLSTTARPDQYLADVFRLRKVFKNENFDIVLTATTNDLTLAIAAKMLVNEKRCKQFPKIVHYTGNRQIGSFDKSDRKTAFRNYLVKKADGLITICKTEKKQLHENRINENVFLFPPLVEHERFSIPDELQKKLAKEKFGFNENDIVIGLVGRFKARRYQLEIIEAFKEVVDNTKELRLLMVGYGEDLALCKWLTKYYGLSDKLVFTGFLEEKLPVAYHAMDVFVLPEIGNDGYGRAAIEAFLSGVSLRLLNRTITQDLFLEFEKVRFFEQNTQKSLINVLNEIHEAADLKYSATEIARLHSQLKCDRVVERFLSGFTGGDYKR